MIKIKVNKKIIISKTKLESAILFVLSTFIYLLPQYYIEKVESVPILSALLTYISFFSICIFLIMNIGRFVRGTVGSRIVFFLIVAEYIVFIYATIINNGRLYPAFTHSINIVLLCVMISFLSNDREKCTIFLKVIRDISLFFCVLNLLMTIIYPSGIPNYTVRIDSPMYLYGNVNATIRGMYPGISSALVLDRFRGKKIGIATGIFGCSVIYIIANIYFMATTVICVMTLFFWILFEDKIKGHIRIVYSGLLLIVAATEFAVVVNASNLRLTNIVANLFGKSLDFSGRRALWIRTIVNISDKIWLGHGFLMPDELYRFTGNKFGSHNYYLDIVFQRGMVGLIICIIIWIYPVFLIKKRQQVSNVVYMLMGLCGALLITFISEPFYSSEFRIWPLFYVMIICLYRKNTTTDSREEVIK